MKTCKWCQTSSKTKILDHEGVCQACRDAARYPSVPMHGEGVFGDDRDTWMPTGGKKTKPVWAYDTERDED